MGSNTQHTIIGFIVIGILWAILKYYDKLPELTLIQYALIAIIIWAFSNLPDIDLPNSKISKFFYIAGGIIIIWAFIKNEKAIGITTAALLIFFRSVSHRTIIHSIFFAVLLSAPLWLVNPIYSVVAFICYLAHITSEGELSLFSEGDIRSLNIFKSQGRG